MRIGIDISQIVYGTGVSRYTRNLFEVLLKIDRKNEYALFFSSLRKKFLISNFQFLNKSQILNSKFQIRNFRFPPTLLDNIWNRLHILPIEKFIGPVDVFHSSDWVEPPAKCPKVTTIHDLSPLLFPKETHPRIVAVHKRKLEWVKKESRLIIAVSESTKKDIIKLLGIPEGRIRVIYEACNTEFTKKPREDTERIKKKYGIRGDYLLAFGGSPRKNLERVIQARVSLKRSDLVRGPTSLVIVGKQGLGESDLGGGKLDLGDKLKVLGYVGNEELAGLYSGARCLVYPSLHEGFGLPILEAMTCGCPVVTSNISSMPEVAGKAAVLVNPLEVEDIGRGIKEAIEKREEIVKKGYQRVKLFSWEKCAKETLKVYEEAIGSSSDPKGRNQN